MPAFPSARQHHRRRTLSLHPRSSLNETRLSLPTPDSSRWPRPVRMQGSNAVPGLQSLPAELAAPRDAPGRAVAVFWSVLLLARRVHRACTSPHNTLHCLWLSDTRNSLQVSKIAEANFLVFDAAVANLAIGDPMARYVLFCLILSAFGAPANLVHLFQHGGHLSGKQSPAAKREESHRLCYRVDE